MSTQEHHPPERERKREHEVLTGQDLEGEANAEREVLTDRDQATGKDVIAEKEVEVEEDQETEEEEDMPMTMAASVVLEHLPRDAHQALSMAGVLGVEKITLHFRPGPGTPALRQSRYKMSSSLHFSAVIKFLRRKLGLQDHESVFCYVNQVFAPALDEGVGNLWRCFKTGEELVISYSVAQSFG